MQLKFTIFESLAKLLLKNIHNNRLRIRLVIFRNGFILYDFFRIKNKNIN